MISGSAGRSTPPGTAAGPFRLYAVSGYQNRSNDIVYCPPIVRPSTQHEESTAIVYFGGDVQDFPENMENNRDSRGYMKYNLESSAVLLRNTFPKYHIIIIRPVRMEFKTFSCFENFVRGNNVGVPDHTPMNNALQHLEKLLQNISHRLKLLSENDLIAQSAASTSGMIMTTGTIGTHGTANINDGTQEIDILQVHDNVNTTGSDNDNSDNSSGLINTTTDDIYYREGNLHMNNTTSSSTAVLSGGRTDTIINNDNNGHYNSDYHQTRTRSSYKNPLWWKENLNLDKAKLMLIGFSKGCVVLNQFIYEFHYLKTLTPDDSTMMRLLSRIKEMYWLDGGHGGNKNTWITSRSLLETLTRLGIRIHVHVTPYQVQDERRHWIRKEEKMFTEMLQGLGAPITRNIHFEGTPINLFMHFEVLQAFCQYINSSQHQQISQRPPNNQPLQPHPLQQQS